MLPKAPPEGLLGTTYDNQKNIYLRQMEIIEISSQFGAIPDTSG
jgi:hypothetical protein